MDKDLIEPGDIVNVYLSSGVLWAVDVLHCSQTVGDPWRFRETRTDTLIYVQVFEKMTLVSKYERSEGDENVLPFTPY